MSQTPAERLAAIAARADVCGSLVQPGVPCAYCGHTDWSHRVVTPMSTSSNPVVVCVECSHTARQDVPDLVAFAQAVLALCDGVQAVDGAALIRVVDVRRLADEHLGGDR